MWRFVCDEHIPDEVVGALQGMFPKHSVKSLEDLGWRGLKDVPLMHHAKSEGFHAVVTRDKSQSTTPHEYETLVKLGLNWLCVPQAKGYKGSKVVDYLVGNLSHGIRQIIRGRIADPQLLLLRSAAELKPPEFDRLLL